MPKLHVNVDHVATVRQARREPFPDPVVWALRAEQAGAQGITCHLRVDRRHIQDDDVRRLRAQITTRLNLELSLAPEIVSFALESGADAFCIVPESREEVTTEGGLDVRGESARLAKAIPSLAACGGDVSLFINPDSEQIRAAADSGAPFIELHTGRYALAKGTQREDELVRLAEASELAQSLGLRVNAGHGLDYDNVMPVALLSGIVELNIGFAIISESLFSGVDSAIVHMEELLEQAREFSTP